MAISAQDKILYVANKLGLSTLKDMQGSTGAIYDADTDASGTFFQNSSQHTSPGITNLNDNQFEVNSALLIETIGFYQMESQSAIKNANIQGGLGPSEVVVFDLIIGNKVVMKNTPVFGAGQPYTFASTAVFFDVNAASTLVAPRHQVFLEGAGILIPPQVEFSINYSIYNWSDGTKQVLDANNPLGCYLFGTRVLLNFNTSI